MADTVTAEYIFNSPWSKRKALHLTSRSDGTGESAVIKADISTLTFNGNQTPTYTTVKSIDYNIQGIPSVRLDWDHTTDDEIVVLPQGSGTIDFFAFGGKTDPRSTGGTGDIILTTAGAANGTYDILIHFTCKT